MSENKVLYLVQWWTGDEWHIHEVYGGVLYLHEPISQPAEDIWSDHVAQPPSRVQEMSYDEFCRMDGEA